MAAAGTRTTKRRKSRALLDSLELRLDLLTRTLNEAEISEKSIDIVKEIKELHAILRSLREVDAPEQPQALMVVWGGPQIPGGPCGSSSGSGPLASLAARSAPSSSGAPGSSDASKTPGSSDTPVSSGASGRTARSIRSTKNIKTAEKTE